MLEFDEALECIQIEVEMEWLVLDWWKTVNRIERSIKCLKKKRQET